MATNGYLYYMTAKGLMLNGEIRAQRRERKLPCLLSTISNAGWIDRFDPAGMDEILEGLYLGGDWAAKNKTKLLGADITHILTVAPIQPQFPELFEYYLHSIDDDGYSEDLLSNFPSLHAFIDDALDSGGKILVHCHAGASRSATVVVSYCMRERIFGPQLEPNLRYIVSRRPVVCPHLGFYHQLMRYQEQLSSPASASSM